MSVFDMLNDLKYAHLLCKEYELLKFLSKEVYSSSFYLCICSSVKIHTYFIFNKM